MPVGKSASWMKCKTGRAEFHERDKASVRDMEVEPPQMPGKLPQSRKEDKVQTGQAKASVSSGNADFIAIALKKLHRDVEAEAVPKEFMDILADIDRKIGSSGDIN